MTPRGETGDLGQLDRLDGVDQAELGAVGLDWTWETCRGQRRDSVTLRLVVVPLQCVQCVSDVGPSPKPDPTFHDGGSPAAFTETEFFDSFKVSQM